MTWINVKDNLPEQYTYVLVHTPYCKYKCYVAFWNGLDCRSIDDVYEVGNMSWWQPLPSVDGLMPNLEDESKRNYLAYI